MKSSRRGGHRLIRTSSKIIKAVPASAPPERFKDGGLVGGDAPVQRADKRSRLVDTGPSAGSRAKGDPGAPTPRPTSEFPGFKSGGWIKDAIKHPGAETKAAKKAGMSTHAYMEKHKDAPGKAGARARLGLRLSAMAKKK